MKKVLSCFLFLLFIPFQVYAQKLWQKTEYGMSLEQVQKLYPQAITPEKPETVAHGSYKELLRIPEIKIFNHPFRVSFYFDTKDKKLRQVMLSFKPEGSGPEANIKAEVVFDTILEVLRTKYGKEINLKRKKFPPLGIIYEATWIKDKTNIYLTLIAINMPKSTPILNITYNTKLTEESNKL